MIGVLRQGAGEVYEGMYIEDTYGLCWKSRNALDMNWQVEVTRDKRKIKQVNI